MNLRLNLKVCILAIGLGLLLVSCDSTEELKAPPITGDATLGADVFITYCAACHQADGKGKAGFAPSLNNIDFLQVANDHQIKRFILEGRPGTAMMPYKNNDEVAKNIDDLVVYLRSFKNNFELYSPLEIDNKWSSPGDATNGGKLFTSYCAPCHGGNGEGYASGGSGTAIGNPDFLKIAPDDYLRQTMLHGRAGTAMKSFDKAKGVANVDEAGINDIIAFLRSKAAYHPPVIKAESEAASAEKKSTSEKTPFKYNLIKWIIGLVCIITIMLILLILLIKNMYKSGDFLL